MKIERPPRGLISETWPIFLAQGDSELIFSDARCHRNALVACTTAIANQIFSRVLLSRTTTASSAIISVKVVDIDGAEHTTTIVPNALAASNTAPTVTFDIQGAATSVLEEATLPLDFITVGDVDAEETPNA